MWRFYLDPLRVDPAHHTLWNSQRDVIPLSIAAATLADLQNAWLVLKDAPDGALVE
jgi:hypothetical protein